jgi:hypothetical protein
MVSAFPRRMCNIEFKAGDIASLERVQLMEFLSPLLAFPGSNPAIIAHHAAQYASGNAVAQDESIAVRSGAWALYRLISYLSSDLVRTSELHTFFTGKLLNHLYSQVWQSVFPCH